MLRRGIVPFPAVREANVLLSRAPVELLLVPCRFLPKLTRIGKRGSCGCSFVCVAAHLPTVQERAMKLRRLTRTERKVWQAAVTDTEVDLRVGDSQLDAPDRWAQWAKERTVRAEVRGIVKTCGLACHDEVARSVEGRGRSCRSDQEPSLTIRSVVGSQPVTNG
jgi:hypothetical protein